MLDEVNDEQGWASYTGRLFAVLTLTLICFKVGQRLIPPLLPAIIDDLAITPFAAGIAISMMDVMRALLQYPSGRLSDRLSRKTILLPSIGFAILGFSILAITPNYAVLLVGAAFLGGAIGFYDPADRALISDLFPDNRGRAFGVHLMAPDLGGIIAAGLAVAVAATTWRAAFVPSILVLVLGFVMFLLWSREPITIEWVDFDVLETVKRLLGPPQIRWPLLVYAIAVFVAQGVASFLPTFLIAVHDFPFGFASGAFALLYVVGIVARPIAGWTSDSVARLAVAGGGILLSSLSLGVLIVAPSFEIAVISVIGYAFGQRGFGPVLTAYLMDRFPDETMGGDLGGARAIYTVIGSAGPAYVGFVAGTFNYSLAFGSVAVCLLIAAGVAFVMVLRD